MNKSELRNAVQDTLQGKTPDQVLAWAQAVDDLATAKDRIEKLTMVVYLLIYDRNFILGDMPEEE